MYEVPKSMRVFNLVSLRIFERLYEVFPEPIEITPGTIGIEVTDNDATSEEAFDAVSIAESSLEWLALEGFLRYESSSFGGVFHNVQLTLKGLTILGSIPASVSQYEIPEPMIKRIKRVLQSGVEKTGEESVRSVLNEVLRIAFNASISAVSSGLVSL